MNYGAVAYLDRFGGLRVADGLLRILGVSKQTRLDGYYYPSPDSSDPREDYFSCRHDFMLTPVPRQAWARSLRLKVDLLHSPGALADVAEELEKLGANIVMANCTRSTHRYTTWNAVIEFCDVAHLHASDAVASLLSGEQPAEACRGAVLDAIAEREADLSERQTALIQRLSGLSAVRPDGATSASGQAPGEGRSLEDYYDRRPVRCWKLKGLTYFSDLEVLSRLGDAVPRRPAGTTQQLSGTCIDVGRIRLERYEHLQTVTGFGKELPMVGFAHVDTDSAHMRIAFFSRAEMQRVRRVRFDFTFDRRREFPKVPSSSSQTTAGVVGALSRHLANEHWNIWRFYNRLYESDAAREHGRITIFMGYRWQHAGDDVPRKSNVRQIIESALSDWNGRPTSRGTFRIKGSIDIAPVASWRIFISVKGLLGFSRSEELIEACRNEAERLGIIREQVDTTRTHEDPTTLQVIRDARGSSAMLQLISAADLDANLEWLSAEYMLAKTLGIPVVRIVSNDMLDRLRFDRDIDPIKVGANASAAEWTEAIREAMGSLVERLRAGVSDI